MRKKADMGMETLILIIAVIIVAAVAAGVLISTSGILSQQSLITGQAARKKITNHMNIDLIRGESDADRYVQNLVMRVSLTPGSDSALLNTTTVTDITDTGSGTYYFLPNAECRSDSLNGYYNFDATPLAARTTPFMSERSNRFSFTNDQTSAVLIGKVAVAIIFVESNDQFQPSTEDWTRQRQDKLIESLTDAFNWWRVREPRAGIEFVYKVYRNVPCDYEPISNPASSQALWLPQVLDYVQAPAGATVIERVRAFDNELRDEFNAHWGVTLFAVATENDPDDAFVGGIESGWAYINGPYAIVTSETMGSQDNLPGYLAHELGHLFGASDQYSQSDCNCSDRSGYLEVLNENCDNPSQGSCFINDSSIMRTGADMIDAYNTGGIDPYGRGQLGLIDTNENNILDPVEIAFGDADPDLANDQSIDTAAGTLTEYTEKDYTEGFFAVERVKTLNVQRQDVLEPGESAIICFKPSKPLEAHDQFQVHLLPIAGQLVVADVKMPDVVQKSEQVIIYEAFK